MAKKPLPRVYPSKEDTSLGASLKRKRLTKGWTRLRTSIHLEVSEDTYRNWEWNWFTPDLRYMNKVTDFLGFNFWDDGTQSLSNRCLLYRIEHCITQQELANLIGIGKTTIGRIENYTEDISEGMKCKVEGFITNLIQKPH